MTAQAEILQKLAELDHKWKQANDERVTEFKKTGEDLSCFREKLEKIEADVSKYEETLQRLDDLEVKMDRPMREVGGLSTAQVKHLDAFDTWVRDPTNREKGDALKQAAIEADPRLKAVATTTGAAGGHAVPEIIASQIEKKLLDISMMRNLVNFVTIGSSDYKQLVNVRGQAYGWAGETDTRSETNTSNFEQVAPTMGTIYAYPQVTEEALEDMFFDVASWMVDETVEAFLQGEGAAIISGDGSNKPTGFLNGTPVATSDAETESPLRPFGTLEYVPTGAAAGFQNGPADSPVGSVNRSDFLLDLEYALKPRYRQRSVFVMNKSTLKEIRKFKDNDGNYIWQRSMVAGQPSTLNGYPVYEFEDMPSLGANTFPIAFGDFASGYLAVNRSGFRMTQDQVTTPGYVKYYMRRRLGGIVKNDDAIKLVKCATS